MARQVVDEDFVAVREEATTRGKPFVTLAFGNAVEVLPDTNDEHPGFTKVRIPSTTGFQIALPSTRGHW